MKSKQNPFRVRPIRKSWHEKFWKKGTWRTHHTALFAMLLVVGVVFGFDAAFGAAVVQPYFNAPAPSVAAPPSPAPDAAAPNNPSGAPTGSSTVTPKFSGANIQGYVFNQATGDGPASDSKLQLYDYVNVWGQLDAINGIANGGYTGLGIDPYLNGSAVQALSPAVLVDDLLDNRGGIVNLVADPTSSGFVNVWDALQISPLGASPTTAAAGQPNRSVVVNNRFGESDIEFDSANPGIWQVGTGRAGATGGANSFYISGLARLSGRLVDTERFAIDTTGLQTTLNANLTANGIIQAPLIRATEGGDIGQFYNVPASDTRVGASVFTKNLNPVCNPGDKLVSCGGFQQGSAYKYQGAQPSVNGCSVASVSASPPVSGSHTLWAYAYCFDPD